MFFLLAWLITEICPAAKGSPQTFGKTQDHNLPLVFLLGSGEDPAFALASGTWFFPLPCFSYLNSLSWP